MSTSRSSAVGVASGDGVEAASSAPIPALRPGQLRAERVRLVVQFVPLQVFAHTVCATALVLLFWDIASRPAMLAWNALLVAAAGVALATMLRYRYGEVDRGARRWPVYLLVYHVAFGLIWGAAALVFFPPAPFEYRMILLVLGVGLAAGALSSTSYLPAYYAFMPVSLMPMCVAFLLLGDTISIAFGVLGFIYIGGMLLYATVAGGNLTTMLRLQLENQELARRLAVEKRQAEQANLAKSQFLAAASHDLRQPLHAMMLFTSALQRHIDEPAARGIVDNIRTSAQAMEELFNALLDISRLDAGALEPSLAHFNLREPVARVLNDFGPEAHAKHLSLQHEHCDVVVCSDPLLLERVLRNLVSNAIRYTAQGEVRLRCLVRGDTVRVQVSDTGIGFAPAEAGEIFREFHQLRNAERDRSKGLGLGLAIVERIARLLRHPLDVQTTPGEGSCFTIAVPLGDAALALRAAPPAQVPGAVDLGGLRVVVIDDERSVRDGMLALLEQWGCEVVLGGSEDEALEAVRAASVSPQAIVTDFRLRGNRTGTEAIARLRREFGADIPALIVTGDIAPASLLEARASGHPLVHKPVQPAMLRAFLHSARKVRAH